MEVINTNCAANSVEITLKGTYRDCRIEQVTMSDIGVCLCASLYSGCILESVPHIV